MKFVAYIVIFVLCFLNIKSKAQIYFNNKYDTFGSCDATNGIDTIFGGYIYAGTTCSSLSFNTFMLSLHNLDGTINKKKIYLKPNNFRPNRRKYFKTVSNSFFVSGYKTYHTDTSLAFLWKFNSNLDSLKYSEFGFLNKANIINTFISHSNYLYHAGYVDSLNSNADILLIKTDTAGNEIWKKKIGVVGWDENAITIDTLNGKLLIGGIKIVHNTSTTFGLVMCIDTSANIIWQKTVNTNNGYKASGVKTLKDGNVLIYSAIKKYTIGSDNFFRMQCEKISPSNTTIWLNEYNAPAIGLEPSSVIENHRGNIVVAGQTASVAPYPVNGLVNEISQNGDSLFTRQYAYQFGCQNYFRDLVQATDKGYCFAGFYAPIFANGCSGSQDVWLLKVDSNFCESIGYCGYPTGIKSMTALKALEIYPNPASNKLNFKFESGINEHVMLILTDVLGKAVAEYKLNIPDGNEVSLDVSYLLNGMYYYNIEQNGVQFFQGKISILK